MILHLHTPRTTSRVARAALIALAALLPLPSCADDDGGETDPLEDVELDVCEHYEQGPIAAVTAGTDAASATATNSVHTRYDVSLPSGAGFVKVAIEAASTYSFFFSDDATVVFKDVSGAVVAPVETRTGSAWCDAIGKAYVVTLGVGTYTIEITGASGATATQFVFLDPAVEEEE